MVDGRNSQNHVSFTAVLNTFDSFSFVPALAHHNPFLFKHPISHARKPKRR